MKFEIIKAVTNEKMMVEDSKNLILILEGKVLPKEMKKLDKDGKLAKIIETQPFDAKAGEVLHIPGFDGYENIWLIGAEGAKNYVKLGAGITRALLRRTIKTVHLFPSGFEKAKVMDMISGMLLRDYVFDAYKNQDKQRCFVENVQLMLDANCQIDTAEIEKISNEAEAVKKARDLINLAPCDLYPESMANKLKEWLEPMGVKVKVLKGDEIRDMGLLCAVGRASTNPAHVVVMEWLGYGNDAPIALVGKGVTYDSGGLSLKPSQFMEKMKSDMSGSAVVAGVMANIALNKYKKNVVGIIGLVENMVAGNAYKPDDIITARSGKTVEIVNTDAEGRLVLADILDYVQDNYKPAKIVDLATLTGAITIALGSTFAGLFTNNDDLAKTLIASGDAVAEPLWRMPLDPSFDEPLNSPIADMKHCETGRGAGSSIAAMFLQRFIKNHTPWAHLDIAGVSFGDKEDFASTQGATGFGIRLLHNWICK